MSSFALVQLARAESVCDYRTILSPNWSVVSFYLKEGDRLTASWHVTSNPIDVYVLGEVDYELYIGGSSFNSSSEKIGSYDGYIDLIAPNEGVLFTIFHANYSGSSNVFFHVSVLRDIVVNCTCNCSCTDCTPQSSSVNFIPGFSIAIISALIIISVIIVRYKLKKRTP